MAGMIELAQQSNRKRRRAPTPPTRTGPRAEPRMIGADELMRATREALEQIRLEQVGDDPVELARLEAHRQSPPKLERWNVSDLLGKVTASDWKNTAIRAVVDAWIDMMQTKQHMGEWCLWSWEMQVVEEEKPVNIAAEADRGAVISMQNTLTEHRVQQYVDTTSTFILAFRLVDLKNAEATVWRKSQIAADEVNVGAQIVAALQRSGLTAQTQAPSPELTEIAAKLEATTAENAAMRAALAEIRKIAPGLFNLPAPGDPEAPAPQAAERAPEGPAAPPTPSAPRAARTQTATAPTREEDSNEEEDDDEPEDSDELNMDAALAQAKDEEQTRQRRSTSKPPPKRKG